jgi:hypothetical protein
MDRVDYYLSRYGSSGTSEWQGWKTDDFNTPHFFIAHSFRFG